MAAMELLTMMGLHVGKYNEATTARSAVQACSIQHFCVRIPVYVAFLSLYRIFNEIPDEGVKAKDQGTFGAPRADEKVP